eukprot:CAMPEP_0173150806 /NCGR_PEP_ID=MMETSP1105-20130129/11187_1 /TAXON_ID=2985 /ORGANISM="Ochromonas sp., Strain BG-1" /LENGTH=203 /DNA_ID=CAMNT_0014066027 /DNA_START=58 /DNA_END=669 /DNA_ORIENTATION=+
MAEIIQYQPGQPVIVANFGVFGPAATGNNGIRNTGTRDVVEAQIVKVLGDKCKVSIGRQKNFLVKMNVNVGRIFPLTIGKVNGLVTLREELIKTYEYQELAGLYIQYPFIISEKQNKMLAETFNKDWRELTHMEPNRLWNAFHAQDRFNLFDSQVNKLDLVRALILPPREEDVRNEMVTRFRAGIDAGEYSESVANELNVLLH